jgi:hypothetical protein
MVPSIVDKACWRESKDDFGALHSGKTLLEGTKIHLKYLTIVR